jgi:hypothetical protein
VENFRHGETRPQQKSRHHRALDHAPSIASAKEQRQFVHSIMDKSA